MARINIPGLRRAFIDDLDVYYSGKDIFISHKNEMGDDEASSEKDFWIELSAKDAIVFYKQLKEAVACFLRDIDATRRDIEL